MPTPRLRLKRKGFQMFCARSQITHQMLNSWSQLPPLYSASRWKVRGFNHYHLTALIARRIHPHWDIKDGIIPMFVVKLKHFWLVWTFILWKLFFDPSISNRFHFPTADENVQQFSDFDGVTYVIDAIRNHMENARVVKNACMALASLVESDGESVCLTSVSERLL